MRPCRLRAEHPIAPTTVQIYNPPPPFVKRRRRIIPKKDKKEARDLSGSRAFHRLDGRRDYSSGMTAQAGITRQSQELYQRGIPLLRPGIRHLRRTCIPRTHTPRRNIRHLRRTCTPHTHMPRRSIPHRFCSIRLLWRTPLRHSTLRRRQHPLRRRNFRTRTPLRTGTPWRPLWWRRHRPQPHLFHRPHRKPTSWRRLR